MGARRRHLSMIPATSQSLDERVNTLGQPINKRLHWPADHFQCRGRKHESKIRRPKCDTTRSQTLEMFASCSVEAVIGGLPLRGASLQNS